MYRSNNATVSAVPALHCNAFARRQPAISVAFPDHYCISHVEAGRRDTALKSAERETAVCFPVLRDVRVADELVRAEEPLALEALHAPRLRVDGRLGQQDADTPPEALVLHL